MNQKRKRGFESSTATATTAANPSPKIIPDAFSRNFNLSGGGGGGGGGGTNRVQITNQNNFQPSISSQQDSQAQLLNSKSKYQFYNSSEDQKYCNAQEEDDEGDDDDGEKMEEKIASDRFGYEIGKSLNTRFLKKKQTRLVQFDSFSQKIQQEKQLLSDLQQLRLQQQQQKERDSLLQQQQQNFLNTSKKTSNNNNNGGSSGGEDEHMERVLEEEFVRKMQREEERERIRREQEERILQQEAQQKYYESGKLIRSLHLEKMNRTIAPFSNKLLSSSSASSNLLSSSPSLNSFFKTNE